MTDISKIDKNFAVSSHIEKEDIKFYKAGEGALKVFGVFKEGGIYRRMPETIAKSVSRGVDHLHVNTAGGRVKFATDSSYIAINAQMHSLGKMSHFALTGSIGFDMYADGLYVKTFVPPFCIEYGYEGVFDFDKKQLREITINFPLYSGVTELYIGLEEGAVIKDAEPYKNKKPVVYYGSSITQGGCASRPGMSYQAIVSQKLNCNYINLGFSGNARAEDEMITYIKNLDMSVFVYDYDHNAPTLEHLEKTHERMFKKIREANPDLPIIMMNRPKYYLTDEEKIRKGIIETTYKNALNAGDKNVYFIDNIALTKLCKDSGTVDNGHPTDFGFASMAEAVIEVLKNINI